jgi:hypothetical protein
MWGLRKSKLFSNNSEVEVHFMTLLLAVNGRESIWMLADRRLTYEGLLPKDDANKVMFLETKDGAAILGYAGLGATALGTEPADWMSAVLRGQNLPLEESLRVLAGAMKRQFPRHMIQMPGNGVPTHIVIINSLLGNQIGLYTINSVSTPERNNFDFLLYRHVFKILASSIEIPPKFVVAGTGAIYLNRDKKWTRGLLDIIRAHDRCHVSPNVVSDYLANLNYEVHLGTSDKSVGSRCIVAWRYKKGSVHKGGGAGGHQFYTETSRDSSTLALPTISVGIDAKAVAGVLMELMKKKLDAIQENEPTKDLYKDELIAKLARLPNKSDENLL